jgi:hypothetical protein
MSSSNNNNNNNKRLAIAGRQQQQQHCSKAVIPELTNSLLPFLMSLSDFSH